MRAKGLVMEGLAATADRTQVNVVGKEGDHSGPIELPTDVLDGLGDARVPARQWSWWERRMSSQTSWLSGM